MLTARAEIERITVMLYRLVCRQHAHEKKRFTICRKRGPVIPAPEVQIEPYTEVLRMQIW